MKRIFFQLLLILVLPASVYAEWDNVINNYTRNHYQAGSQNWQIAQLDNNWMYFANKMGVLEFNGRNWNLYSLNNGTDTRSLYHSKKDNRIYTGGINEFGYLEPDASGKMYYHCLWDPSNPSVQAFGNIWNIYEIDNTLYFCEDHTVIKYVSDSVIPIASPGKIDCSGLINNTLHIGTSTGIYVLAGDAFYRLPETESLTNKKLRAIVPYKDNFIIATARDGLYSWDKMGLRPMKTEVDKFIQENELFSIAVQEDLIALGTVLKGVVLISDKGELIKYINDSHGLQNNTVLSCYFDLNGNLWLGLDNGIDYVALNYPITNLYSHANFYGAGYVSRLHKDKLYLGTNRGLYVTDWPIPKTETAPTLRIIDGTQGQVWGLRIVDNTLFLCHDLGLFTVESENIKPLDTRTGVWDLKGIDRTSKYWVSNYNGFNILEVKGRNRYEIRDVPGLSGSYINFNSDSPTNLFLRSSRTELHHITTDRDQSQVLDERFYRNDEIPDDYSINKLGNQIILSGQSGIYVYDNENMHFVPDDSLNLLLPTTVQTGYFKDIEEQDNHIWALGNNMLIHLNKVTQDIDYCFHTIPLITNFEKLNILNDSLIIIPNENGFALWSNNEPRRKPYYPLQITEVFTTRNSPSIEPGENLLKKGQVAEIPYSSNTLIFLYNLVRFVDPEKVLFQTQLDNEPWSDFSSVSFQTISDIPIGKHIFRVRTQLANQEVVEDAFSFEILPPWYRTIWAYLAYIALLIVLILFIRRWDDKRIERKRKQLRILQKEELKKREEEFKIETEKKEKEIIRLQNEQLEMDIRFKSQKLATSAIILGRKNEVLINIKDDLLKLVDTTNENDLDYTILKRRILQVQNKIDDNIKEDDSFQQFEENFDIVHNNFIKRLTEAFPSITIAERKMCAYIKMELSSKEIAPLLNISIRGVETLRYRLRKKLRLSREESLTQFLMNF